MKRSTFQSFDSNTKFGLMLDTVSQPTKGDHELEGNEEALLQFMGKSYVEAAEHGIEYLLGVVESWEKARDEVVAEFAQFQAAMRALRTLRPLDDWHEDMGCATWFRVEEGKLLGESPYTGSPLDEDWPEHGSGDPYYTHWIPLVSYDELILPEPDTD